MKLRRRSKPSCRKLKTLLRWRRVQQRVHWKIWTEECMTSYLIERTPYLLRMMRVQEWTTIKRQKEEFKSYLLWLTLSWVYIIFQKKSIASIQKMIKILSSLLLKITQIIQVSFIHSTKRKEKDKIVTLMVQSKVFYQESNKMLTKRWWSNWNSLRKIMDLFEDSLIPISTRTKCWQRG